MLDTLRMHQRSACAWARMARWAPALLHGVDGLLRARARAHPHRACLRDLEQTLSYRDVDVAVDQAARLWTARGVRAGEVVAFVGHNALEVLVHQLGLARAGAAAALVNPQVTGDARRHVLDAVGARWVVEDAESLIAERQAQDPSPFSSRWRRLTRPACYLFTSGTTGLPKAAPITHARSLMCGAALQGHALWLEPDDVVFTPLPIYHASAQLIGWSLALNAGACLALAPRFSASRYWAQAAQVGATVCLYVGELCRYLLEAPGTPPAAVHTFLGNGLRGDVWRRFQRQFGVRVVEFYGATEGNTLLINRTGKVGSCGRPVVPRWLNRLELAAYDAETDDHVRNGARLQRPAAGQPGELLARISWNPIERFDGYVDPQATSAKVLRGAFRRHDRYFRSGDLLRQDRDGDFFFVDRLGDTFRWKGENVSTQEVEAVLADVLGVEAVVVYGVEVPGEEGRAGMAAFVGQVDVSVVAKAVATLPRYARPQYLRRVESLEHTSTMKLKKTGLVREGRRKADWYYTGSGYAPVLGAPD